MPDRASADIVLINPRFEVSYWGLEHAPAAARQAGRCRSPACRCWRRSPRRAPRPLVDENVEPIDFDRLARADIVGLTGMSVQRARMREILAELKRRGRCSPSSAGRGSPCTRTTSATWPTSIFVGEAEETWPQFLDDWRARARPGALRAGRHDRHDAGAGAALRPARDAALPVRQRAVLARLPVPVRVLRHHRHLRPPAAAEDAGAGRSPSWRPCAPGGWRSSSSSTTT